MKKFRRIGALLLSLVLIFSFSACGSFEKKLIKGVKEMQDIQSLHMDVEAELGVEMNILKQSLDMNLDIKAASDIQTEPFKMNSEIDSDMMGFGEKMYIYIEEAPGGCSIYLSEDGNEWQKDQISAEGEKADIDMLGMLSLLAKYAAGFTEAGEEKILQYNTVRYDGSISSDDIAELIELLGGKEIIQKAVGDSADLDSVINSMEGDFSIPTSIWLDKESGMIIKYSMDVTQLISGVMDIIMDELIASMGSDIPDMGVEIKFDKMLLEATLSQFDEVGDIKNPAA